MTTTDEPAASPLLFNPFDPAYRADPYPVFKRLREEAPVHQSPLGFTVLSRYADCAAMLRDPRASSNGSNATAFEERVVTEEARAIKTEPFLFMDPPDHTRLRGLVTRAFTPRVVEGLRPRIEQLVRELLDAARERGGSMDVIADLAYPLPVTIISEMLGVPPEDSELFQGWSRDLARGLDPDFVLPPDTQATRDEAIVQFAQYFVELIEKRRRTPGDDLLTALIAAEEEGNKLSEDELLATCILLLIAGHETTVNLIGNGMLTLLRHPQRLAELRDDPSLIRTAVEELLRFDPPVQMTARTALEDLAIGDVTLPKGQFAVLLLASANRDPAQFERPDELDLRREENRHLAFGMGIHFCLGAPLARIEGQVALAELARRLRQPELATDSPAYKENLILRGLRALPVSYEAID
jgi:unspecific monooxygenase